VVVSRHRVSRYVVVKSEKEDREVWDEKNGPTRRALAELEH
jgi:hypothetical protein